MTCKGICIPYKADSNHHANGQKRCQICETFIKWMACHVLAVDID